MADETKRYRIKHGHNHFQDGQFLEGGSIVELTDAQYASFKDKFVREDEPLPPPPAVEEELDEEDTDDGDEGEEDLDEGEDLEGEEGAAVGEAVPEGSDQESPIARRRREKAKRKAERAARNKR